MSQTPFQTIKYESKYEKIAAAIVTMLLLVGLIVVILFMIWLTTAFLRNRRIEVVPIRLDSGTGVLDTAEFDPEVDFVGTDMESDEPTLQDALARVSNVIAERSSFFADPSEPNDSILLAGGTRGDGRTAGNGDANPGKRHWEFVFPQGNTAGEYARQLDFFGIELAVLQPGGRVCYVSRLSAKQPSVRIGSSDAETRYYMTWLKGDLQEAEKALLGKANVDHEGKLIIKLLPPALEQTLANLEIARADGKRVHATYFGVRKKQNRAQEYEFYVLDQIYD